VARTVAFIPVRGGSTSIPLKNIKPMLGKPLVYWTAQAASLAPSIDAVYVATDSPKIKETVEALRIPKVEVIGRSPETATNTASSESALLEFAESQEFDTVVFVQATSPLLQADDLERGLELMRKPECDSVISVVPDGHFYWTRNDDGTTQPANYDVNHRPRRQEFRGCWQENGAFYITGRDALLASRCRVSGTIYPLPMPEDTLFEIDEVEDWPIIEMLLRNRLRKSKQAATAKADVRVFLSDCDGCLTDAGMYYDERGNELKKFNTRDGMAFSLLRKAGIKCGILTSETSPAVERRAAKLKLDFLEMGCTDKLSRAKAICEREGISLENVAYVGDDLNDVALLQAAGLSFAPKDACEQARHAADVVIAQVGGRGVVRAAAEELLEDE
jgi:YrbI family 3-deoxy-D-manno-octulosonate 8-phosphate phosphatase